MNLNNPSLHLCLTTVPITAGGGQKLLPEIGTGFFMDFTIQPGKTTRWLITNKHVVQGADVVHIRLHAGVKDANETATFAQDSIDLPIAGTEAITVSHPNEDLCGIPWTELARLAAQASKTVTTESFPENLIPSQADLENLSAIEEVVMVGYPIGLKDEANNLPIARRGITGSHPGLRFNNECRGIVDMACYHGSSGSPVLVWSDHLVWKNGQAYEQKKRFLLGVNVDFQHADQDAIVMINNAPTTPAAIAKVKVPLHMGKYIRAEALLILKNEIIAQGKFL